MSASRIFAREPYVKADAANDFVRPLLVVAMFALAAGAVDTIDFAKYSIFTANQTGNLVFVWLKMKSDPGASLLSFVSLVGCAAGIILALVLRMTIRASRPHLLTVPLLLVSGLLIAVQGVIEFPPPVAVGCVAVSLGMISVIVTQCRGIVVRTSVCTGPYLDAWRFGAASAVAPKSKEIIDWRRTAKTAAVTPIAYTIGAALSTALEQDWRLINLGCGVVIGLTVVFVRRGSTPLVADAA